MPEYSYYLGDAVKSARIRQGLTQKQVADDLSIDDRTLTNIECNRGNPKMEILYPLVRYLNIDARDIFNPERKQDTPCMKQLRVLIDGCTEHEAKALIPVIQAVCSVLRDRNTLEMKKEPASLHFWDSRLCVFYVWLILLLPFLVEQG